MTTPPVARVSAGQRAVFCSDIHLDVSDPALTARFLRELATVAKGASHLFVLGDLFEAWVGDDQNDPLTVQLHDQICALLGHGVQIFLLHGNRDFLIGVSAITGRADARNWHGITLLPEEAVLDLFGEAVLITHGDQYCIDDDRYQQFRALRNRSPWRSEFLSRSLDDRLTLARQMRKQSELEKADKSQYLMDVNPTAIVSAMNRAGVEHLIHGHTHRPAHHHWQHQGRWLNRWVLPDWQGPHDAAGPRGRGGFLQVTEQGFDPLGNWAAG